MTIYQSKRLGETTRLAEVCVKMWTIAAVCPTHPPGSGRRSERERTIGTRILSASKPEVRSPSCGFNIIHTLCLARAGHVCCTACNSLSISVFKSLAFVARVSCVAPAACVLIVSRCLLRAVFPSDEGRRFLRHMHSCRG